MKYGIFVARSLIFCLSFVAVVEVEASLSSNVIDVYSRKEQKVSILIENFTPSNVEVESMAHDIAKIVANDLSSSGYCQSKLQMNSTFGNDAVFARIRDLGYENFVTGNISPSNDGKYVVKFTLWDVFSEIAIVEKSYAIDKLAVRKVGHVIADAIMMLLIGKEGMFSSKIIYVDERIGERRILDKRIAAMDQDGYNYKAITPSGTVITPSFSKARNSIVYVAFVSGQSHIQTIDVRTGKVLDWNLLYAQLRNKSLISPQISPDGSFAMFSILDGKSANLYKLHFDTKSIVKLTNDGINVSPSFSPDGNYVVFNSNIDGKPALYIMTVNGRNIQRISSSSGYYSEPSFSPDGQWIVFTKLLHNVFHIGIMRPDGSDERVISSGYLAESPSWSPSGREVIFSFKEKKDNLSKIKIVSIGGRTLRVIDTVNGASDPVWVVID